MYMTRFWNFLVCITKWEGLLLDPKGPLIWHDDPDLEFDDDDEGIISLEFWSRRCLRLFPELKASWLRSLKLFVIIAWSKSLLLRKHSLLTCFLVPFMNYYLLSCIWMSIPPPFFLHETCISQQLQQRYQLLNVYLS